MTYVFAVGPPPFSRKALFLARSIRRLTNDRTVMAFVAQSERDLIPNDVMAELGSLVTVVEGQIPIPSYPLSAKIAAMVEARRRSQDDTVVLLDTDMILLAEPSFNHSHDEALSVKPVDLSGRGGLQHREFWEQVYDILDIAFPERRLTSTIDREPIFPYWNAGVVASSDPSFAREWLDATRRLYRTLEDPDRFVDQVALGAISTKYGISVINERDNYPLTHHFGVPADVRILHYHRYAHLHRVPNPRIWQVLADIGLAGHLWGHRSPAHYHAVVRSLWHVSKRAAYLRAADSYDSGRE